MEREKVRAQVILLRVGLATLRFCILVFEQLMGRLEDCLQLDVLGAQSAIRCQKIWLFLAIASFCALFIFFKTTIYTILFVSLRRE